MRFCYYKFDIQFEIKKFHPLLFFLKILSPFGYFFIDYKFGWFVFFFSVSENNDIENG